MILRKMEEDKKIGPQTCMIMQRFVVYIVSVLNSIDICLQVSRILLELMGLDKLLY